MATSILDLLDAVIGCAVASDPSAETADTAIAAAGQFGRALERLTETADQSGGAAARRQLAVGELARACLTAGSQWPTTAGRTVDLAAAAADHIGRGSLRLDVDERWAVAVEVSRNVQQLAETATQFAPYAGAPALLRVQRLTAVIGQFRMLDPPTVSARACLDTLIPGGDRDRGVGNRVGDAVDNVAQLIHAVDSATRHGTFTIAVALTVAAAAESAAEHATTIASSLAGPPSTTPAWANAAQSWRVLQAAIRRFDDGSRYAAPTITAVTESALALHDAITTPVTDRGSEPRTGADATRMRYVANQLPALAGQVERALAQAVAEGKVFAMARGLPQTEERAGDYIGNRAVVVRPPEIASTRLIARTANRASVALAVELDRSADVLGRQPQPNLIRALAAELPYRAQRGGDDAGRRLWVVAAEVPAR